jgi:hypothetical protein
MVGAGGGSIPFDFFKESPGAQLVTSLNGGGVALKEVVDMAALGRIKNLLDRYPLSAVKEAYDDFKQGHLVGRAVLMPQGISSARSMTRSSFFLAKEAMTLSTPKPSQESELVFETLNVRREAAVLFVEISAPPMNLAGPELIRDLVSLIQQAEADETSSSARIQKRRPRLFHCSCRCNPNQRESRGSSEAER